jgi:hypothetical protein
MLRQSSHFDNPARFGAVAAILIAIACSGCGSKSPVARVRGKVLLDDKPLAMGSVVTLPRAGRGATGAINDGEFELSTFGTGDGALIGTHKVAVVANEPSNSTDAEAPPGKLLVPQRYTNPATSGLTIEVKAGEVNTPTLKLTSP